MFAGGFLKFELQALMYGILSEVWSDIDDEDDASWLS